MLELDGVTLERGDFRLQADLALAPARIHAILGPSGAGKSTLLDAVAGFLEPRAGRILWQGRDITGLAPARRPMSILFQDANLFGHLSARDNVALGLSPALRLGREQWREVDAALERVGIGADLAGRRPAELSGGQGARVALARVLLRARPMLLLDEPFGALGPGLRARMLALVAEIAGETGAMVAMVSHDPGDAAAIADDIVLIEGGRVHPPVATRALLADPPAALREYLGN